jgi:hypothetical protein
MMIACLDTSVINVFFLGGADKNSNVKERLESIQAWFEYLEGQEAVFFVPAVALAELSHASQDDVKKALRSLPIEVISFDDEMGFVAAALNNAAIAMAKAFGSTNTPKGELRTIAKFDALMVASAVAMKAKWLLHANPKDFPMLAGVAMGMHPVQVIAVDRDPVPTPVAASAQATVPLLSVVKPSQP